MLNCLLEGLLCGSGSLAMGERGVTAEFWFPVLCGKEVLSNKETVWVAES